jgi:DNA-binding MurR/RpiR family transcriptional regulator
MGAGLASALACYLRMVKSEVSALTQGPFELAVALKDLGPEDVVLGIGFTRYAYAAAQALKVGRGLGAKTIGIISQADCPIGSEAEILLSCSSTAEGYMSSSTATSAVLFALFHSLTLDDAGAYDRELDRFQNAYAKLNEGTARGRDLD